MDALNIDFRTREWDIYPTVLHHTSYLMNTENIQLFLSSLMATIPHTSYLMNTENIQLFLSSLMATIPHTSYLMNTENILLFLSSLMATIPHTSYLMNTENILLILSSSMATIPHTSYLMNTENILLILSSSMATIPVYQSHNRNRRMFHSNKTKINFAFTAKTTQQVRRNWSTFGKLTQPSSLGVHALPSCTAITHCHH